MCETFHDRRRRHHRDHGRSQAADTPSSSFRTSHPPYTTTPHNTRSRGGQESRYSGLKSPVRDRPGSGTRFFWVLRSSRQVGAGSRGRVTTDGSPSSHQNSAVSQNAGAPAQRRATQPRPCARADITRPATANSPPVCRECNTRSSFHHDMHITSLHITFAYIITYYIRTHRPTRRV